MSARLFLFTRLITLTKFADPLITRTKVSLKALCKNIRDYCFILFTISIKRCWVIDVTSKIKFVPSYANTHVKLIKAGVNDCN